MRAMSEEEPAVSAEDKAPAAAGYDQLEPAALDSADADAIAWIKAKVDLPGTDTK